jgi:anti-anti-sigma factor
MREPGGNWNPADLGGPFPMTYEFRVEWRDEDRSRLVWVSGEVDLASVGDLRESLDCDQPRLLVDLRRVTFIDMSGLRCLVDAAGVHEAVALITSPRVDRLLELTATGHLFEIERAFGET